MWKYLVGGIYQRGDLKLKSVKISVQGPFNARLGGGASQALRPAKTGKTATTRTIDRWWGTRQSKATCVLRNLLFQRLWGTATETVPTEPTVAKKQLSSKTVHPSATESPALKFQVYLKALVYDILPPSPCTGLSHPSSISRHWFTTSFLHLQALVYNILHL